MIANRVKMEYINENIVLRCCDICRQDNSRLLITAFVDEITRMVCVS